MPDATDTSGGWFARARKAFGTALDSAAKEIKGFRKSVDVAATAAKAAVAEKAAGLRLDVAKIKVKGARALLHLIGSDEIVQDDNRERVESAIDDLASAARRLNAAGHRRKARELDDKRREIDLRLDDYVANSDFAPVVGPEPAEDDVAKADPEQDDLRAYPNMKPDRHDGEPAEGWVMVDENSPRMSKQQEAEFEAARRKVAKKILEDYADACEAIVEEAEAYADLLSGVPLGKSGATPARVGCDAEKALAGTPHVQLPKLELPVELLDHLEKEGVGELLLQKMHDRNNNAKDKATERIRALADAFAASCARIDADRAIADKASAKEVEKRAATRAIDAVAVELGRTLDDTVESIVSEWKISEKRAKDGEFAKNIEIVSSGAMATVATASAAAAVVTAGHGGAVGAAVLACMGAVQGVGKVSLLAWAVFQDVESVQRAVGDHIKTLRDKLGTLNDQDGERLRKAAVAAGDIAASALNAALGGHIIDTVENIKSRCRLWGDKLAELYFGQMVACKQIHAILAKLDGLKGRSEEYDNQIVGLGTALYHLLEKAGDLGKRWETSNAAWREAEAVVAEFDRPGWLVAADRLAAATTQLAVSMTKAIDAFGAAENLKESIEAAVSASKAAVSYGLEAKQAVGKQAA